MRNSIQIKFLKHRVKVEAMELRAKIADVLAHMSNKWSFKHGAESINMSCPEAARNARNHHFWAISGSNRLRQEAFCCTFEVLVLALRARHGALGVRGLEQQLRRRGGHRLQLALFAFKKSCFQSFSAWLPM